MLDQETGTADELPGALWADPSIRLPALLFVLFLIVDFSFVCIHLETGRTLAKDDIQPFFDVIRVVLLLKIKRVVIFDFQDHVILGVQDHVILKVDFFFARFKERSVRLEDYGVDFGLFFFYFLDHWRHSFSGGLHGVASPMGRGV